MHIFLKNSVRKAPANLGIGYDFIHRFHGEEKPALPAGCARPVMAPGGLETPASDDAHARDAATGMAGHFY